MSMGPWNHLLMVESQSFSVFVAAMKDIRFHAAPDLRRHSGLEVPVVAADHEEEDGYEDHHESEASTQNLHDGFGVLDLILNCLQFVRCSVQQTDETLQLALIHIITLWLYFQDIIKQSSAHTNDRVSKAGIVNHCRLTDGLQKAGGSTTEKIEI